MLLKGSIKFLLDDVFRDFRMLKSLNLGSELKEILFKRKVRQSRMSSII